MDPSGATRLTEGIGDGVLGVDAAGRFTFVNAAGRRLLGIAEGECREGWFEALALFRTDQEIPLAVDDFAPNAAWRRGEVVEQDVWVGRREDPERRRVLVRAFPVHGASGTVAVAMICADTPRGSRAEAARTESYVDLLRVVNVAANKSASLDEALVVALRAVCRALGWSVGQVHLVCDFPPRFLPGRVAELADPERYRCFRDATERTLLGLEDGLPGQVRASRRPIFFEDITRHPDFARRREAKAAGLLAGFAFPILVRDEVVAVVELFAPSHAPPEPELLDVLLQVGTLLGRVVERDRAMAREAFFRAVIDHVGDPIFVKDRLLHWVVLNRAFTGMVGFPHDAMIGKSDPDFFPPEQAEFFNAKDREMFASGSRVTVEEEPITDGTGKVHWLATTKVPLRSASGEVTHLVGIIHDITRLKTVEADLKQRNEELAAEVRQHAAAEEELLAANRDLEGFCWSVSHDLRQPLRAIDGFSSVLLSEHAAALDDVGQKALSRIRTNVHRMGRLIDDLLQLSRVARAPVHRQPVDLGALAAQVIEELRTQEPDRRVAFAAGCDLVAGADPGLARLLLENLIGNAWKFTSRRAEAHIELALAGDAFYVRDDGAGFEMSHAAMLFKPFCRLHRDEEFPGTGIGLATVQRIVERHGGRVWAEGTAGRGATVWFTLSGKELPILRGSEG